jgi:hypothetical protein
MLLALHPASNDVVVTDFLKKLRAFAGEIRALATRASRAGGLSRHQHPSPHDVRCSMPAADAGPVLLAPAAGLLFRIGRIGRPVRLFRNAG